MILDIAVNSEVCKVHHPKGRPGGHFDSQPQFTPYQGLPPWVNLPALLYWYNCTTTFIVPMWILLS